MIKFRRNDGHTAVTGGADFLDPIDALNSLFDGLGNGLFNFSSISPGKGDDGYDRRNWKMRIGRSRNREKGLNTQGCEQQEDDRRQLPALYGKCDEVHGVRVTALTRIPSRILSNPDKAMRSPVFTPDSTSTPASLVVPSVT